MDRLRRALVDSSCRLSDFVRLISAHGDVQWSDCFDNLSSWSTAKLWSELLDRLSETLSSESAHSIRLVADDETAAAATTGVDDDSGGSEFVSETTASFVSAVVPVALGYLRDPSRTSEAIFPLLSLLNEHLFRFGASGFPQLPSRVSELFETYWIQQRPQRENLVPRTISFLLIRSLEDSSTLADVQRLFNIRDALHLIDFEDESSSFMKNLLMKVSTNPHFLSNKIGRRFISYLLSIDASLMDSIHEAMKIQLPTAYSRTIDEFSEIYLKAWKNLNDTQSSLASHFDTACLQDLISVRVHAKNTALLQACHSILEVFHQNKRVKGLDAALLKVYEPILWRSLNAANPQVRLNAATLFTKAFPLQNPDSSQEEIERILQVQFEQLERLLGDPSPAVRSVGVQGVCRVVGLFWELIPSTVSRQLIDRIVGDLAFDASSDLVRVSAIEGVLFLLENHMTHPMLSAVMPRLGVLFHDVKENVRAAMLSLLIQVKALRAFRFYDIVSVDSLLARLATDSVAIATKITHLLLNTFFPYNKSPVSQVQRAMYILKENLLAGERFFTLAAQIVPPSNTCRLIGYLLRYMQTTIKSAANRNNLGDNGGTGRSKSSSKRTFEFITPASSPKNPKGITPSNTPSEIPLQPQQQQQRQQQQQQQNSENHRENESSKNETEGNKDDDDVETSVNDERMESVLRLVNQLLKGLDRSACTSLEVKEFLDSLITDSFVSDLYQFFEGENRLLALVMELATHQNAGGLPNFSRLIIPHISQLKDEGLSLGAMQCLVSWNQLDQITEATLIPLSKYLDSKTPEGSRPLYSTALRSARTLSSLLSDTMTRVALLQQRKQMQSIFVVLEKQIEEQFRSSHLAAPTSSSSSSTSSSQKTSSQMSVETTADDSVSTDDFFLLLMLGIDIQFALHDAGSPLLAGHRINQIRDTQRRNAAKSGVNSINSASSLHENKNPARRGKGKKKTGKSSNDSASHGSINELRALETLSASPISHSHQVQQDVDVDHTENLRRLLQWVDSLLQLHSSSDGQSSRNHSNHSSAMIVKCLEMFLELLTETVTLGIFSEKRIEQTIGDSSVSMNKIIVSALNRTMNCFCATTPSTVWSNVLTSRVGKVLYHLISQRLYVASEAGKLLEAFLHLPLLTMEQAQSSCFSDILWVVSQGGYENERKELSMTLVRWIRQENDGNSTLSRSVNPFKRYMLQLIGAAMVNPSTQSFAVQFMGIMQKSLTGMSLRSLEEMVIINSSAQRNNNSSSSSYNKLSLANRNQARLTTSNANISNSISSNTRRNKSPGDHLVNQWNKMFREEWMIRNGIENQTK